MSIDTYCEEDTYRAAIQFSQNVKPGQTICFYGEMGSGKTIFSKGVADGLGIKEVVNSPTFTIVKEYHSGRIPLYHFDVYRIGDVSEMDEIGFCDMIYSDGICLIEWAELIEEILPEHYTKITFTKNCANGNNYRNIVIEEV